MDILYFGHVAGTCADRAAALRRLGHVVNFVTYESILGGFISNKYLKAINYRTGNQVIQYFILDYLKRHVSGKYDLGWVSGGEFFGPAVVEYLKKICGAAIVSINDDPLGSRDGARFMQLRKALRTYDVLAIRSSKASELIDAGARKVVGISMSYDEVTHCADIESPIKYDVSFVGTWIKGEDRDKFLAYLLSRGIDVKIWGARWQKSSYWPALKSAYMGGHLVGRQYTDILASSKICLGFLSHGNRDLHTRRSFEIPYAGSVLCAERTSEHLAFFKENEEAIFWADEVECASQCIRLLGNVDALRKMRIAGHARVLLNKVGNEDVCRNIIREISA